MDFKQIFILVFLSLSLASNLSFPADIAVKGYSEQQCNDCKKSFEEAFENKDLAKSVHHYVQLFRMQKPEDCIIFLLSFGDKDTNFFKKVFESIMKLSLEVEELFVCLELFYKDKDTQKISEILKKLKELGAEEEAELELKHQREIEKLNKELYAYVNDPASKDVKVIDNLT